MSEDQAEIAVIGGTGVYGLEGLENAKTLEINTPFGKPSSPIVIGTLSGIKVAFLARHDTTHRLLPSEIPFRANVFALKLLGVKYVLSFGACGSLREEMKPQDIVVVDQFIDRTKARKDTFFEGGIIAHIAFGEPVDKTFADLAYETIKELNLENVVAHHGGTYVCIEGPAFSTKAESNMYRQWGGSVIGMTAIPESKLVREAEMAYVCVALVTDFDCWHPDHDQVTVEMVVKTLKKNGESAQLIVKNIIKRVAETHFSSPAHHALQHSILTPRHHIPDQVYQRLEPIIGKYLKN
jgi:5'-methylthioadenosine phosphorylase